MCVEFIHFAKHKDAGEMWAPLERRKRTDYSDPMRCDIRELREHTGSATRDKPSGGWESSTCMAVLAVASLLLPHQEDLETSKPEIAGIYSVPRPRDEEGLGMQVAASCHLGHI